jgi:hypothetical protein
VSDENADDILRLRGLSEAGEAGGDGPLPPPSGSRRTLVKTVTVASYPTVAKRFYGVRRVRVTGSQAEGATATYTEEGPVFFAANLGNSVPPVGTIVEATFLPYRWAFTYG